MALDRTIRFEGRPCRSEWRAPGFRIVRFGQPRLREPFFEKSVRMPWRARFRPWPLSDIGLRKGEHDESLDAGDRAAARH
jgi:hypothetical protein